MAGFLRAGWTGLHEFAGAVIVRDGGEWSFAKLSRHDNILVRYNGLSSGQIEGPASRAHGYCNGFRIGLVTPFVGKRKLHFSSDEGHSATIPIIFAEMPYAVLPPVALGRLPSYRERTWLAVMRTFFEMRFGHSAFF
jgi:hypothetical protein